MSFAKRPVLFKSSSRDEHIQTLANCCFTKFTSANYCGSIRTRNIVSIPRVGCIKDGTPATGLRFDKDENTLSDRLRDSTRPLDLDSCLTSVKEGLDHLCGLGFNHNDINSQNIMLNKQDMPMTTDFNSCQWEGGLLFSTGTSGWTDDT